MASLMHNFQAAPHKEEHIDTQNNGWVFVFACTLRCVHRDSREAINECSVMATICILVNTVGCESDGVYVSLLPPAFLCSSALVPCEPVIWSNGWSVRQESKYEKETGQ